MEELPLFMVLSIFKLNEAGYCNGPCLCLVYIYIKKN